MAFNSYGAYKKVNVETASQGKLVVLLFNGAIQRASQAKAKIQSGRLPDAHNDLIRAQDIINELRKSLDLKTGPLACQIDRIYEYFHHLLVQANLHKDTSYIDECVALLSDMRDTWQEAFGIYESEQASLSPAPIASFNGSMAVNIKG